MKKSLIIAGAVVLVLFLMVCTMPFLFKDRIKKAVDDAVAESIDATVSYEDFSLSLFSHFPKLSLSLEQLSITGVDEFAGDTLIVTERFTLSLNPIEIIFSDKLEIKNIAARNPRLKILILEDGTANYQIAADNDSTEKESDFAFSIKQWEIVQGTLLYDDRENGVLMNLQNIDHTGGGNFTQDLFDLTTTSTLLVKDLRYEEISYLTDKQLAADMVLEMDLPNSRYTFKQNSVSINQFEFGFDGWLSLPEESDEILMDFSFASIGNEFRHLLSCVPGMYQEGFEDLTTDGLVTFNGKVAGSYSENQVPSFNISLKVENGMFQYPDLPESVSNINLDLLVANEDGIADHTLIDIKQVHLDFGQNPLDGKLRVNGLSTPEIKADLTTALDLAQLTSLFPMDGTTLRGKYQLSLKADGTYDSASQVFPKVDASMRLEDGYIKSDAFPESLDRFVLISRVTNQSGRLPDTRIEVPKFGFVMDGEPFSGHLTLVNPHNFSWDMGINGAVDLEKMAHVFDLQDMTLKGVVRGNLASSGSMSSLEAERYHEIPTSGDLSVESFSYSSQDLDLPIEISSGSASFDPKQISLSDVKARTGATDLRIDGKIYNYISYVFKGEPVTGGLNISSNLVDLNEWMEEETSAGEPEELAVLEIPGNLDLNLQAEAATVLYDNMTLKNARGSILIKDGIAELKDISFNSLGGGFLLSGIYDPRDLKHPKFDMGLEIQQVSFKESFDAFNTVKVFAPVAQLLQGKFSTKVKLNGELQQDMMPDLSTIGVEGLINIATAALSGADSKLVQGLSQLTQFNAGPSKFELKDVIMAIEIENGQMQVAPFTAQFGDYKTLISGSTGIDGSMKYQLNMEVPAGVVGTSVNQAIAKFTNSNQPVDDKVNLNINLTGNYNQPKFNLGTQGDNSTLQLAKSAANQKKQAVSDSAKTLVDQERRKLTESASKQLDSLVSGKSKDSTANNTLKETAKEVVTKEKVDEVLNIFKKKKKKESDDPQ